MPLRLPVGDEYAWTVLICCSPSAAYVVSCVRTRSCKRMVIATIVDKLVPIGVQYPLQRFYTLLWAWGHVLLSWTRYEESKLLKRRIIMAVMTEPMEKYQALSIELAAVRKKIKELEATPRTTQKLHIEMAELEDEEDSLLDRMDPIWQDELSETDIQSHNNLHFESVVLELLENSFSADPEKIFVPMTELRDNSVIVNWFFEEIWVNYANAWKAGAVGEEIAHLNVTVDLDGVRRN